jgi:sulfonate transport system substrate-binding protein
MKNTYFRAKSWFNSLNLRNFWVQGWRSHPIKTLSILFGLGLCLSLVVTACSADNKNDTATSGTGQTKAAEVVRIGYQKSGIFFLIKNRGGLEKRLAPTKVEWKEFSSPTPLIEALGAASIDIGQTGDAGTVTAQAGGIDLLAVGTSRPSPKNIAIVVKKDSPIQKVSDLKGKKVGFNKGSNAHYLVITALEKAGLKYTDMVPVPLLPPEGRAAFEKGSIDAWAIWDPFLAAAEQQAQARVIVDGNGSDESFREFYIALQSFTQQNPTIVQSIITEAKEVGDWAMKNPKEVAKILAPALKQDVAVLELSEGRKTRYGAAPIQPEAVQELQKVADKFYALKLIPREIKVAEVAWSSQKQAEKQ